MTRRRLHHYQLDGFLPVSDSELAELSLQEQLRWCADRDGYIERERAERVAAVRDYRPGWVELVAGRHWEQVYQRMLEWSRSQRRRS